MCNQVVALDLSLPRVCFISDMIRVGGGEELGMDDAHHGLPMWKPGPHVEKIGNTKQVQAN